jgi:prepilin-type processing-associated H-X9-DG protein/prepilin-type N-terminal cleavage/methylation domain-containing protein
MIDRTRRFLSPGFTLVEAALVVAILGLLAAVAISVVGAVLDRSRETRCLSNLRQIGLAVQAYAADHEQTLPDLRAGRNSKNEAGPVMDEVLLPYAGCPDIFRCPGDRRGLFESTGSSYFWNYLPVLRDDGTKNLRLPSLEFSLTGARDPARIPLVADKEAFHGGGKRSNILYADGSARPSR